MSTRMQIRRDLVQTNPESHGLLSSSHTNNERTDRMTEVNFEEFIDQDQEEDVPEHVLWIAIEQKHLDHISRVWTILCIIVQKMAFLCIIAIYVFIGLIKFGDKEHLTPLYFKNINDEYYFYLYFANNSSECIGAIEAENQE